MYDSFGMMYDADIYDVLTEIYGLDDGENFQSYTGSCIDELSVYNLVHVCDRDLSYIVNYSSDCRKAKHEVKRDEKNEDEDKDR